MLLLVIRLLTDRIPRAPAVPLKPPRDEDDNEEEGEKEEEEELETKKERDGNARTSRLFVPGLYLWQVICM